MNLQYLVGWALSSCLQMHQCCPAQRLEHTPHTSCKGTEKVSSHTQSMHQPLTLFTQANVPSFIQNQLEPLSLQRGHSVITYLVTEPQEAQLRSLNRYLRPNLFQPLVDRCICPGGCFFGSLVLLYQSTLLLLIELVPLAVCKSYRQSQSYTNTKISLQRY